MDGTDYRIGTGYDIHRLSPGRNLVIGGVTIPFDRGLDGHSDADVLVHAICDAILGAIGCGDIGEHFPDTDPALKGISSLILLERCTRLAAQKGYQVSNLDCTVFAGQPRLSPYKRKMAETMAPILGVHPALVNIKATTTEQLGFIGREEGIAAQCTLLLKAAEKRTTQKQEDQNEFKSL